MATNKTYPVGPPEEEIMGADRNIGLGRVIEWIEGKDKVVIEMLDENGYHCIGVFECLGWTSSHEGRAEAFRIASMPPIATYYGRQAHQHVRSKRRER